jgi:hypothetical protein
MTLVSTYISIITLNENVLNSSDKKHSFQTVKAQHQDLYIYISSGTVTIAFNPSYLEGRDWDDCSLVQFREKISVTSSQQIRWSEWQEVLVEGLQSKDDPRQKRKTIFKKLLKQKRNSRGVA